MAGAVRAQSGHRNGAKRSEEAGAASGTLKDPVFAERSEAQ
ncbi:MAG: hypothetical protein SOT81_10035 [Treponema sp.]|nr:hypothetical protein [Treponema sp.]